MNDQPFVINDRFFVYPRLGLVKQKKPVQEIRLEPRLMQLLCILAAHKRELVGREILTKEVWDDYGNADEGLTQAISYLRKVLNDEEKTLIETVPKRGYVLHADINLEVISAEITAPPAQKSQKLYWVLAFVVLVVVIATYFILTTNKGNRSGPADVLPGDKMTDTSKVANPDVLKEKPKTTNPDQVQDTSKKAAQSSDSKK